MVRIALWPRRCIIIVVIVVFVLVRSSSSTWPFQCDDVELVQNRTKSVKFHFDRIMMTFDYSAHDFADLRMLYARSYLFCTVGSVIKTMPECPDAVFKALLQFSDLGATATDQMPCPLSELQAHIHYCYGVEFHLDASNASLFGYPTTYTRRRFLLNREEMLRNSRAILGTVNKLSDAVNADWNFDSYISAALEKISLLRLHDESLKGQASEFHWVDPVLCLQILVNAQLSDRVVPIPIPSEYFDSVYGMPHEWTDIVCNGSMQWGYSWTPIYWEKPWDWQHVPFLQFGALNDKMFSTQPPLIISVHDVFTVKNIAHIIDSVELFWSIAAAARHSSVLRENINGIVMFSLFSKSTINTNVIPFVKLLYRAVFRYCVFQRVAVYVEDSAAFADYIDGSFAVDARFPLSSFTERVVEVNLEMTFPALLERPLHNVMTPEGSLLLQASVWYECALSVNGSKQASEIGQLDALQIHLPEDFIDSFLTSLQRRHQAWRTRLVVLAYRTGARHVTNLEEIYSILTDHFQSITNSSATYLVLMVNFGSLTPCDQIDLMSQASWFIFIHGAEGGLISFLRPNSVVIEIHPAGCCIDNFDTRNYLRYYEPDAHAVGAFYHFHADTVASTWACDDWLTEMMVSPICGTYIFEEEFRDMIIDVHDAMNLFK
jgi:hypothetical protein